MSGRSTFSPHPSMGLPPRWNVGDLSPSYSTPVEMLHAVSANTTSVAFNPQANSVELWVTFSVGDTKCDIAVSNDDGTGTYTTVATFKGVSLFNCSGLSVGELTQGISLGGRSIKVAVQNYSGTGTVTVRCNRLN